ncbi:McrB family protein [Chryseobacterium sp. Leaf180]|uniref:McrB family protein n=1 Tax=Chryseobacterium sp. Leaf180 TaxID=1736289 RepID=UPI0009EBBBBB|nr:AAA family ATPase [Chryseobacterium sp. Leaf180]
MFIDLYDENTDLEIRMKNFQDKAEELREQLKVFLQQEKFNAQQDERTISVYLSFRYPEKYIFYMYSFYSKLKAEFDLEGKVVEKNNYLELMTLLSEFKTVIREREDFIETYRHYYPQPDWDDTNLMIQNILFVGYRDDFSGIHDGSLLHFSTNELKNFYGFLSRIIEKFDLKKNDDRFVFNQSSKQINFTVGQKYVWCLKEEKKQNRYRAISDIQFGDNIEVFESEKNRFINDTDNYNSIIKNSENILKSIEEELRKTKKSGYYKYNSAFFERMAFDENFRTLIFETLPVESDEYHIYKLITNFTAWHDANYLTGVHEVDIITLNVMLSRLIKDEVLSLREIIECKLPTIKLIKTSMSEFDYSILPRFEIYLNDLLETNGMKNIPLNQILYGPPGTGKTYNTINKAISIANPDFNLNQDREILKKEYDRLVEAEQIVFTTFHQSMSYEDFVEGIKPQIEEDSDGNKNVIYEIKDGVFKLISSKAQEKRLGEETSYHQFTFEDAWGSIVNEASIGLDNNNPLQLTIQTPNLGLKIVDVTEKGNLKLKPMYSEEAKEYIVSYSRTKLLQEAFPDLSVIKNIDKEFRAVIGGSNSTAYWSVINYINNKINSEKNSTTQEKVLPPLPHVLIIDEINRGNVSQIFGELITLIEEGKRLGNTEELQVMLPYSKSKFGVPSNLYIIGTMNTADRSVEALDTALRRRFSFVEMMPDLNVLKDKSVNGIVLRYLLETINRRIEVLLGRDHTIGHSYFVNVESEHDLRNTFKNNIIPLLQEYFYGDYDKIGLILGSGFFDAAEKYDQSLFADFTTQNRPEPGSFKRLKSIDDIFPITDALNVLMKKPLLTNA